MDVLAVLGSAREKSHTRTLLDVVTAGRAHDLIDLRTCEIQHFEYGGAFDRDEFGRIVEAMLSHQRILIATPVYWYSMSGRVKVLFERLTDLVTVRKDLGRRLEGRTIYVLARGADPELPPGFEVPFRSAAAYLNMTYGQICYGHTNDSGPTPVALQKAAEFGQVVFG